MMLSTSPADEVMSMILQSISNSPFIILRMAKPTRMMVMTQMNITLNSAPMASGRGKFVNLTITIIGGGDDGDDDHVIREIREIIMMKMKMMMLKRIENSLKPMCLKISLSLTDVIFHRNCLHLKPSIR